MKKRRRAVKTSRAASLKGWRTRRGMEAARKEWTGYQNTIGRTLDDMLPPEKTINRIPKVEWS